NAAAAGMRQGAGLERVDPVAAGLVQLQDARLAAVDDLVEQAEQAVSIDGPEHRGLGGRAGVALALLEERHVPVTGPRRPTLPSSVRITVRPSRGGREPAPSAASQARSSSRWRAAA